MKLRAIRLAEVGIFRDPVAVEDFSGRLDVLIGPNELGKSTIFRALEAVFFKKHTATGKDVELMVPRAGGSPQIEAEFDVDGVRWRITKRFGRSRSAELRELGAAGAASPAGGAGAGRIARGADAEDVLVELLQLDASTSGRFALLWVGQQRSLDLDIDPATGRPRDRGERATLRNIIEQEIDVVAGGGRLRGVEARLVAELETHLQPKKLQPKKGSDYEQAVTRRDAARRELAAARDQVAAGAERVRRLAQLTERHQAELAPAILARLAEQSRSAHERREAAEKSVAEGAHLSERERAARLTAEKAAKQLQAFDDDMTAAAGLVQAEQEVTAERQRLVAEVEANARLLQSATASCERLRERERRASDAARRAAETLTLRQDLQDLEEKLASARQTTAEHATVVADIASASATAERLAELDEACRSLALADAVAAPVSVVFDVLAEARHRITIDGAPASGTRDLGAGAVIAIDGIGTIRLVREETPDQARLRAGRQSAAQEKAKLLADIGVATVDEARDAGRVLVRRQAQKEKLEARLEAIAPAGVDALVHARDEVAARLEPLLAAEQATDPEAGAADSVRADDQSPEAVRDQLRIAEGERERIRSEKEALSSRLGGIGARAEQIAADIARLDARLGPVAVRPVERARLKALSEEAAAAHMKAIDERKANQSSAPEPDALAALRRHDDETRARFEALSKEAQELSLAIRGLEAEIATAGEAEAGRTVQRLEGECARLDTQVRHYELEVVALRLLKQLIGEAEKANRDRFLEPVVQRLAPYLSEVFPGAELRIDEMFSITELKRAAAGEPFQALSDGTREQLAILVRLGFGRLLADAGHPVPLVLDDALVFSDDDRIAAMFKALETAAQHHQVIVFSCRAKTFEALGGHRLAISPWRSSARVET
ncbi:MAG: AAA family ATPase [Hyphomicrobiaceae bacterium]|nr:AAA family ATPase [Hyphomicrobiaceae bacterium]